MASGPSMPPISTMAKEVRPVASAPKLTSIGAIGPRSPIPSTMVAIGNAAPYQRPVNVPHISPVPAPQIDTAPTIAAVGRQVATPVSVPQVIIGIGKHLRRVPVAGPAIWALGQMVTAEPMDEAAEKRLRDIVGPEEAKRDAATQSDTSALANAVHAAAFDALRLRDDWIGQDERGIFTLSDEALHSAGLSRRNLATPAVQDALEAISNEQVDSFNPVFNDFPGVAQGTKMGTQIIEKFLSLAAEVSHFCSTALESTIGISAVRPSWPAMARGDHGRSFDCCQANVRV